MYMYRICLSTQFIFAGKQAIQSPVTDKVTWSWGVSVYAMKAYTIVTFMIPVPNLSTTRGESSAPRLGRLSPPLVKSQRRSWNAMPRGPQSRCGRCIEQRNLLPLPCIKLGFLGCRVLRAWYHYFAQQIYKRQKLCSASRRDFLHTNIRAASSSRVRCYLDHRTLAATDWC
jgi:hypothetical protein